MAAAVSAVSSSAPSAGDGKLRGECISHPSGGGGPCEPLHPEPGPVGVAVSVPGTARTGSGPGRSDPSAREKAVAGGAERGGGEISQTRAGRRSSPGGGVVVWKWAAFDGGIAITCAGFGFRAESFDRQGWQRW